LASQRDVLEPLEATKPLFDAGAGFVERLGEEGRPVFRWLYRITGAIQGALAASGLALLT